MPKITRRAALAGLPAIAATAALPATAAATPAQDPHMTWWRESRRLDAIASDIYKRAPKGDSPENHARCIAIEEEGWHYVEQACDLEDKIAATTATTLDGLLAQARVLADHVAPQGHPADDREAVLVKCLLAGLEQMKGSRS